MITPPLIPLIVSSKRWLKVITVTLPCLCLIGVLGGMIWSLSAYWADHGMTDVQWASESLGYDLLHAVQAKDAVAVHSLIKQGGNPNDAYEIGEGRSLLMIAAEQGELPTVKVLLHAGADVLHKENGETALTLAQRHEYAGNGTEQCFQQLYVPEYVKVVECLSQAEERAYKQLRLKRERVSLAQAAQDKKNNALLLAVEKGKLATVRSLLKHGANPNAANKEGMTALMSAAVDEHQAIIKLLLDHGADTRLKDKPFTVRILSHGQVGTVPIAGRTALQYAYEFNNGTAVMRLLIERGADINVRGTYGDTMLISAAGGGATEKARLLLAKGAALHLRDQWNRTALMQASDNHYTDIIRLLQKAGAKE